MLVAIRFKWLSINKISPRVQVRSYLMMNLLTEPQTVWMALVIFAVATVYSAIGQGGGTGYLAVMAVGGMAPAMMRPTALALNVLASAMAGWKFVRAGRFQPTIFRWSIVTGAPAAMIGASIDLPVALYQVLVAVILIYAAARLFQSSGLARGNKIHTNKPLNRYELMLAGAGIGLVSGLTGIGGGIFLSPLVILAGWADAKNAAGTSAVYTLVNSVVGLAVVASRLGSLLPGMSLWLIAAAAGAWLGSEFGLKGLSERAAHRLLAFALALAAVRSLWAAIG